ncbi:MAG: acetyltransferase [Vicinamibacterales bacterium]
MTATDTTFESWAIVELMGHQRMAGFVTKADFPAGFLRIDVPEIRSGDAVTAAGFTRIVNPAALYAINPCTEDVARAMAASWRPDPVKAWELPRLPGANSPTPGAADLEAARADLDDQDDEPGERRGDW